MSFNFSPKDGEEQVILEFDFSADLTADTLTGSPVVTVTVVGGADDTPSNLLNGGAALSADNKSVLQPVKAGVEGANYRLKVKCSTSGGRVLVRAGILPVRAA